MTRSRSSSWKPVLLLMSGLAACAEEPKPAPVATAAPAPAVTAHAEPTPLAPAVPEPPVDSRLVLAAQQNLHALGYGSGKVSGVLDAVTRKSILDFQKDQGLNPDGRLTTALAEKLRTLRAELPKESETVSTAGEVFVYSDGLVRDQPANALVTQPKLLTDDAASSFLRSLRPGGQATYHLGHRGKDGSFATVATVTCHAGHLEQVDVPAGQFDAIPADCNATGKGAGPAQFHWDYAPKLGQVVRLAASPAAGYARELVAIRPSTASWPAAARTGLDWALTSILEAPPSAAPIQWSSTAVAQHFDIHALASVTPSEAGLAAGNGTLCRRFEMVRTDGPAQHYPGIACKDEKGWYLPGSRTRLASPAAGLTGPAQLADGHKS